MPIRNQDQQYLGWVHREIDNLLAIDAQGGLPTLEAEDRVGLRLEWYDMVDRYLYAVAAYDAGRLSADLRRDPSQAQDDNWSLWSFE